MDWTNTKREADDVDYATKIEKGIRENPDSYRWMAALLGAVDAIPSGNSDLFARARSSYPYTYRAAQAAAVAPVAAVWPKVGVPWMISAMIRDPIFQRYYNDHIAPRYAEEPAQSGIDAILAQYAPPAEHD